MSEAKVCCNCNHNIRTPKKDYIECQCDKDGHYIGYVACFEDWCKHWAKDKKWEDKE